MTKFTVSKRSDLDAGEGGDGRRDAPMDMAMQVATAATPAGVTIFEPMESNENGKRRRRSEAPAAPTDWRSRMERTIRQQAQELMQLHRTVGHLANLLEARAAREEAQWQGMMTSMQEREQKWDARHEDDKLRGAGITNMIAKTTTGLPQDEEGREREKERQMTVRTDGGGLEASQHADTMREEEPEKRQQLQQQPKPKLQLKLPPEPQPTPKPK